MERSDRMNQNKPECALIGEDSNVFNITGKVEKTLKRAGLKEQADDQRAEIGRQGKIIEDAKKTANDAAEGDIAKFQASLKKRTEDLEKRALELMPEHMRRGLQTEKNAKGEDEVKFENGMPVVKSATDIKGGQAAQLAHAMLTNTLNRIMGQEPEGHKWAKELSVAIS